MATVVPSLSGRRPSQRSPGNARLKQMGRHPSAGGHGGPPLQADGPVNGAQEMPGSNRGGAIRARAATAGRPYSLPFNHYSGRDAARNRSLGLTEDPMLPGGRREPSFRAISIGFLFTISHSKSFMMQLERSVQVLVDPNRTSFLERGHPPLVSRWARTMPLDTMKWPAAILSLNYLS
jgi:hypothetical protein